MPDPWSLWERELKRSGRPDRVVETLTDEELLALLASERDGRRDLEKRLVRDELHGRLAEGRAERGEETQRHPQGPLGPPGPGP